MYFDSTTLLLFFSVTVQKMFHDGVQLKKKNGRHADERKIYENVEKIDSVESKTSSKVQKPACTVCYMCVRLYISLWSVCSMFICF